MIKLKNITIILVEPHNSHNIGASARAMKNMGFNNLRLVNPVPYKNKETYHMAWNAEEILKRARCFSSLGKALAGINVTIGTTQRKRKHRDRKQVYAAGELFEVLSGLTEKNKVAILFGRENNGLHREELAMCNFISTIPQHTKYPSLNLSQAVMIFCYELFKNLSVCDKLYDLKLASFSEIAKMHEHFDKILHRLSFKNDHRRKEFTLCMRRILGKVPLESRDIRTFHSFLNMMERQFR